MFSVDSWTCSGQTTRCSSIISRTFGYNDENGIQFGIVFNLGGQPSYLWHINIAQQFVWILNWRKICWWMFWHSSELRGLCLMKWLSKAHQKFTILLKYECMGFCIPKIWQILKHFAGPFHLAWTSYFWRVVSCNTILFVLWLRSSE